MLLLLLLAIGQNGIVQETVDLIEINHYYHPETEQLRFTQVIFYEWSPDYERFHVMKWTFLSNPNNARPNLKQVWIRDGEGFERIVQGKLWIETWTKHDPERDNIKLMPCKYRTGLLPLKRKMDRRKVPSN